MECLPNLYLDPNTSKCIEIPNEYIILNCHRYSNLFECERCFEGYYLDKGNCKKPEQVIKNCSIYENENKCLKCENQYAPNILKDGCLEFRTEACIGFKHYLCDECNQGFIKNERFYISQLFDKIKLENFSEKDLELLESMFYFRQFTDRIDVC